MDHLKGQRKEKEKAVSITHTHTHTHTTHTPAHSHSQLAEEKHAEIWRANCPELRQVEVRQREKAMPSVWREQVTEKTEVGHSIANILIESDTHTHRLRILQEERTRGQ